MQDIKRHNETTKYKIFIWCSLFSAFFSQLPLLNPVILFYFGNSCGVVYFLLYDCFRPKWDQKTSPEELKQAEKDNFLEWRRQLVR